MLGITFDIYFFTVFGSIIGVFVILGGAIYIAQKYKVGAQIFFTAIGFLLLLELATCCDTIANAYRPKSERSNDER